MHEQLNQELPLGPLGRSASRKLCRLQCFSPETGRKARSSGSLQGRDLAEISDKPHIGLRHGRASNSALNAA